MEQDKSVKKKNPFQCFIGAYKKFAVFEGRAGKAEFWWFHFFNFIISLIFIVLILYLFSFDFSESLKDEAGEILTIIIMIWWLFSLVPIISLAVRRMHDCNKKGAFMLIPVYGWIVLHFVKGSSGPNRFDLNTGETAEAEVMENASSAGICRQCNEPASGNYCQNCGSPVYMDKIDQRYFINEIKSVLGVQKGFFYSLKKLFFFSGISAREYIKNDRNNLVKPIIYLFFTALLYTIIYNITGFKYAENYDTEIITKFDQILNFVTEWIDNNIGYSFLIISFISAFVIKRIFKEYKYNIYEILVLMCFLNGTILLISILIAIIGLFTPFNIYETLNAVFFLGIIPVYFIWTVASFFDPRKVKNYFKTLFSFFVPLIYAISIILIFVIVYNYV